MSGPAGSGIVWNGNGGEGRRRKGRAVQIKRSTETQRVSLNREVGNFES